MGILTFLLSNKNMILVAILIAAFLGAGVYIKILKSDLAASVAEKNVLVAELKVANGSIKSLQQAILEQNAAVDKMKLDSDTRIAAHQTEIIKARSTAEIYHKQAQYLMGLQAPQNKSKCDAANDIIVKEMQNAK